MNRDNTYLIGNKHALGAGRNKTSFRKRHRPWNRGVGGIHLSPATEFKKGHVQNPPLPLNTITQRKDKNGRMRNFIKINAKQWQELSHHLWKSGFGFIVGDVIHHINGNLLDDRIINLIALPRQDHPKFHNRWGLKKLSKDDLKVYLKRYGNPAISYWEFRQT